MTGWAETNPALEFIHNVIPAKAGIQTISRTYESPVWIPAFAGMTQRVNEACWN